MLRPVVRPVILTIPILVLFLATAIIFLVAHAPRTWASHWTAPVTVASARGENEYGAVFHSDGKWDLLWVNDDSAQLTLTTADGRSRALDSGEVLQPVMVQVGGYEEAAWVHNYNGYTRLKGAIIDPQGKAKLFTLVSDAQPLEHPFLFSGPHHSVGLIFSWQGHGNFDLYLMLFHPGSPHPYLFRRLTRAEFYSFYPRAVTDSQGNIDLIHLENCCKQYSWHVQFDQLNANGVRIAPTRNIGTIEGQNLPSQWPVDIRRAPNRDVIGVFGTTGGLYMFAFDRKGTLTVKPHLVASTGDVPASATLQPQSDGGYLFWEQGFELGAYLNSQKFDARLQPVGSPARAVYESSIQTNPHSALWKGQPVVLWQAVTPGLSSRFEMTVYRSDVKPTLAQRFGLGLASPWEELGILLVSSAGMAALTTVGNILTVFGLALLGLLALWLLRAAPGRWLIYSALLTIALYMVFIVWGAPLLFLSSIPSLGFATVPFGILTAVGVCGLLLWFGLVVLRRLDDVFRAGVMAVMGVYFFAFIEAIVFVQQRIAFI